MTTPTPRTDAILEIASIEDRYIPLRDLARQLERDIASREDAHAEQLRAVNARELVYANSLAALRERAERAEAATRKPQNAYAKPLLMQKAPPQSALWR